MKLTIDIEKNSGFCKGVIRAISSAEKFLETSPLHHLYSLGAIVHNEAELQRLRDKGLIVIEKEDLDKISDAPQKTLLIRAHGEPPETYDSTKKIGINVIDCTCPVVLNLQKNIRKAYERVHNEGGQIIIFGKIGHAEVLGLMGQVNGDAIVVESVEMLKAFLADKTIKTDKALEVFSQTTKSPTEYSEICHILSSLASDGIEIHKTICSQVAHRHSELSSFAENHDIILFVSGVSSSNGRVLFSLCKERNPRSYHISSEKDILPEWFTNNDHVGICGATSTPRWLLENVANAVSCIF